MNQLAEIIKVQNEYDDWKNMKPPHPAKFWKTFDKIVKYVQINYPEEFLEAETEAKAQRETAFTKFNEFKSGAARTTLIVPSRILALVKVLYGMRMPFADVKQYNEGIWKRYPVFRASLKY